MEIKKKYPTDNINISPPLTVLYLLGYFCSFLQIFHGTIILTVSHQVYY